MIVIALPISYIDAVLHFFEDSVKVSLPASFSNEMSPLVLKNVVH